MATEQVDFGSLTATQRRVVEIAAVNRDDLECAKIFGRDVPTFRAILDDACLETGIAAESFQQRRLRITAAYRLQQPPSQGNAVEGQSVAPKQEADAPEHSAGQVQDGKPVEAGASEMEGASHDASVSSDQQTNEDPMSTATVESVTKKLTTLPEYLFATAKLMAEGKCDPVKVAKGLGGSEGTASNYLAKVSTHLGLKRMPREEKARLIAAAMGTKPSASKAGNGADTHAEAGRARRGKGAATAPSAKAGTSLTVLPPAGPFLSETEIEKLNNVAGLFAGSEVGNLISRAVVQLRCTADIAEAVKKVVDQYR